MLTVNLIQFKRKQRKDGTIPIYIRITEDRKSRYKSTGVSVLPKYWDQEHEVIKQSHSDHNYLNAELMRIKKKVGEAKYELLVQDKLNKDGLAEELASDTNTHSILIKAESWIEYLKSEGRYWEQRHFRVIEGNLRSFIASGKTELLNQIDALWIEDFQKYLISHVEIDPKTGEEKLIENKPQTVNKKIQRLKGMFLWLIKRGDLKSNPFQTLQRIDEPKRNTKVKLSFEQISAIENLKLPEQSPIWHVQNYFMYSFYNAGIRFGDLCTLQWKNLIDGRLEYSMHKTSGKKSIKQLDPMNRILDLYRTGNEEPDDYIFPVLKKQYSDPLELRKVISSKNVIVNRLLKEIAQLAGIQANISFHVSRHSFAHYALKKGMDLYSISKALGHSALKVTEDYIKSFDEELLDSGMEGLFT